MSTYRSMAYSIQTAIKQNFDDLSVEINQIVYWITLIAKRARFDKIKKNRSDAYLVYFPDIPLKIDSVTGRKYAELPATIVDLDNDFGIKTVTFCTDDSDMCEEPLSYSFSRTQAGRVGALYGNPYRRPSSKNVYYFRAKYRIEGALKDVIFFLGLECLDVNCVDMYIYADESSDFICNLDEDINVSPEMEQIIYYEVINLAKSGFIISSDRQNDGSDEQSQKGYQKNIKPVYRNNDNITEQSDSTEYE